MIPPSDLDSEESLLGAMLLSAGAIETARKSGITSASFYKPAHGALFDAIIAAADTGQGVDVVTVAARLNGHFPGGASALRKIEAATPASANAAGYATRILDLAYRRTVQVCVREIEKAIGSGC